MIAHMEQHCNGIEVVDEIVENDFDGHLSYNGKVRTRYEKNMNNDCKPSYVVNRGAYFTNQRFPGRVDRMELFPPVFLKSHKLADFRPQILVTAFVTNKTVFRSLLAVRLIGNVETTNITSKIYARFSIKNTITGSLSPPQTLRFIDVKDPCLKIETWPKISTPERGVESTQYLFTDENYKHTLFYDWGWLFSQKDPTQTLLRVFDFNIRFIGDIDAFLENPFDE